MSALIGKLKSSGEPIIIAAKNIISIQKASDPSIDSIVVMTTVGERIQLTDNGTFNTLLKWFEAYLKLEIER